MIVFPTERSAKENMSERVIPMFSDSPRLAGLLTGRAWDLKQRCVVLSSATIYIGWAGSHQALATRPLQYVFLDEVDKYPAYRGREADAISLARVRTATYGHRGKTFLCSTPTIPSGPIWTAYLAAPDRRTYHVPCPRCGAYAELAWDHVRWPGMEESDAESLQVALSRFASGALTAHYQCPECEAVISDGERFAAVRRGEWVSEGHPRGEHPPSTTVAYRVSGLSSPWTSYSDLAREWLTARLKGLGELQHFFNSLLGLPFWGASSDARDVEIPPEAVYSRPHYPPRVVPEWATVVVASADPGRYSIPWSVHAFGRGYRKRTIAAGVARSFGELRAQTLDARYPLAGGGPPVCPMILTIDAGGGATEDAETTRTEETYRFALTDPARIKPVRGHRLPLRPLVTARHQYRPPRGGGALDVTLTTLDVRYFKDLASSAILHSDVGAWEVASNVVSRDWVMQMTSERRTLIERRIRPDGSATEIWRWIVKAAGAANHAWDCEVYAWVAAYMVEPDREEPAFSTTAPPCSQEEEEERAPWWTGSRGPSW
jgi:phage terminase large subunit GpA-like protein